MFKTETHLHTSEVSRCGKLTAAEMVERYHDAGYTTLFITDHWNTSAFQVLDDLNAKARIEHFFRGWEAAKDAAERYGMIVLPAAEVHPMPGPNEYIVYGIDRHFFDDFPLDLVMTPQEFYRYAHERGHFVMQAHPMRDGRCVPTPDACDGFEIFNTNPRHENYSDETEALARSHGLLMSGGSDAHRPEDTALSGVYSDHPITSAADYLALLRGGAKIIGRS